MNRSSRVFVATLAVFAWSALGRAQPLQPEQVPEPLTAWVPWVLDNHQDIRCPKVNGVAVCSWPGSISLVLDELGGTFDLRVVIDQRAMFQLPGSLQAWPQQVSVDAGAGVVIAQGDHPFVVLTPGEHHVTGRFVWNRLPETLMVPPEVGSLHIRVSGKEILFPRRGDGGMVWLQSSESAGGQEGEWLDLEVHRRIDDGVPISITTRILIRASGRSREVSLGNILLPNTVPMSVTSDLPVRLTSKGDLTVQIRAGSYFVETQARTEALASSMSPVRRGTPWPNQEIWVWSADDSLRQVQLSGAQSIDPNRTNLQDSWRRLPAYSLTPDDSLKFVTIRRGEPEPPPNRLELDRELWLDLEGNAFTVRDTIKGELRNQWRLDLREGELGHAAVNGEDQLITKNRTSRGTGVELRKSAVQLVAESRLLRKANDLPAVAWSEDMQRLSATLHLPPGWRLFGARGADEVSGTWLSDWNLFGFFYVLLIAFAVARMLSPAWGVFAFITLVLCHEEPEAPSVIWFAVLLTLALFRVLPETWPRRLAQWCTWASLLGLVVIAVPFAVAQIRGAIYPQLDAYGGSSFDPSSWVLGGAAEDMAKSAMTEAEPVPAAAPVAEPAAQEGGDAAADRAEAVEELKSGMGVLGNVRGGGAGSIAARQRILESALTNSHATKASGESFANLAQDPNAVSQTGPGVPAWTWRTWQLSWSGPVEHDHRVRVWLLSPRVNALLAFVRVIFVLLLALQLVRSLPRGPRRTPSSKPSGAPVAAISALVLSLFAALHPTHARADFPNPETLQELERRLLRPELCEPNCVSAARAEVEVRGPVLRIGVELHAAARSSWTLPGPVQNWVPQTVRVDGQLESGVAHLSDGFLHVRLLPGRHQLELEGPVPAAEAVTLAFQEPPHRIEVVAPGWDIEGVREDGRPEGSIQLRRALHTAETSEWQSESLPPWLEITRVLEVGVQWFIRSTIRRVSPSGSPVVVHVPLLPGESVTEPDRIVENGALRIALGRDEQEVTWSSALRPQETIKLTAKERAPWSEIWRLQCGSVWQCSVTGLPPVQHLANGNWEYVFRPWPGESATFAFFRPVAAEGQSTTIDRVNLQVQPGTRLTHSELIVQIRTNNGGIQTWSLPPGSKVQSMQVDGVDRPAVQHSGKLQLALTPGAHRIALKWQERQGISTRYQVAQVNLGQSATNVRTVVELPSERWLLWATGPSWGPAILFWGYVVLLLLGSFVLSRIPQSPLSMGRWLALGLGLTQIPLVAVLTIVGWFFMMQHRERHNIEGRLWFNLRQLGIAFWTFVMLVCLYAAIHEGLLVQPDMQVSGNGSTNGSLVWYVDHVRNSLSAPAVVTLPIWVWKVTMLVWSLWLAWSLVDWLRWAWRSFSHNGVWSAHVAKRIAPPPTSDS